MTAWKNSRMITMAWGSDKRQSTKKGPSVARPDFKEKPLVFVSGLSKRIPEIHSFTQSNESPGNQGERQEIREY